MKRILVTGGAGYIGSAIVTRLCDLNHRVLVIDNLSKGQKKYVDVRANFIQMDLQDKKKLEQLLKRNRLDLVIHCSALKAVGESETVPDLYLENNLIATIHLLTLMAKYQIPKIIFSSTACVYDPSGKEIYQEEDPLRSSNHYGFTKIKCEEVILELSRLKGLNYIIFRFFNVAGDAGLHFKELGAQNIFPIISQSISEGNSFKIFGDHYQTRDGTGVRDYLHLSDIVEAHILGINYSQNEIFNLGSSTGTSVLELVHMFEQVTKKKLNYETVRARKGDVGVCLANPEKAHKLLKWETSKALVDMVEDSYQAYQNH